MTTTTIQKLLLFLSCILLLGVQSAYADYYKYQDRAGAVGIADNLESIPPEYRASAEVVRDGTGAGGTADAAAHSGQDASPAKNSKEALVNPPPAQGRFAVLAARYPWVRALAVVCGVLIGLFVLVKLVGLFASHQLGRLISILFSLAILIFLYMKFADQMTNRYQSIKIQVQSTLKKPDQSPAVSPEGKPVDEDDAQAAKR